MSGPKSEPLQVPPQKRRLQEGVEPGTTGQIRSKGLQVEPLLHQWACTLASQHTTVRVRSLIRGDSLCVTKVPSSRLSFGEELGEEESELNTEFSLAKSTADRHAQPPAFGDILTAYFQVFSHYRPCLG